MKYKDHGGGKGTYKDHRNPEGKEKTDSGEQRGERKKRGIGINTTDAVLGGGGLPPGPIMKLPHEGSRTMLGIKQTWITSKYKEVL